MDFGALPPEINSGRMYAGPRSGPMLAAATAWDGLAAELDWAATSYGSALADLTSMSWLGPASASMVAAATPYVAWMSTTAAQAQQTAAQAKAAAAAYEAAFAMTVPPPVIAANRASLMTLVATNILGQNTPAIAATEAHYGEMWAQDAAAMYGYAGASAAASTVTPFTAPTKNTNPAGLAGQAAQAVTQASSAPAQAMVSASPQLIPASAAPHALHSLASTSAVSSASSMSATSGLQGIEGLLGSGSLTTDNLNTIVRTLGQSYFFFGYSQFFASIAQQLVPGTPSGAGAAGSSVLDAPSFSALADLGGIGPASVSASVSAPANAAMLAGMGKAGSIGGMSVPQGWAAGSPAVKLAAAQLPMAGINASPAGGPAGLLRGVPLAGAGAGRRAGGFIRRYGFRHKILRRPPMAG